jgi:hypothetical protein
MKYCRILFLLMLFPGCAAMDDYYAGGDYYEGEYYMPAAGGCPSSTPTVQPGTVPAFSQPSAVHPAGYQTREPPM